MVSDWLKLEFIETFFTKLAEDGLGDRRRMEFWKRYVKAIDNIEFALGSTARNARDRDFVALRKKMEGLICHLDAAGSNNAFIMRMGDLVAVEFSGMGNALYGYDARRTVPFDTAEPLRLPQYDHNSLKQKNRSILWLSHQDGINGWAKWEQMFDAKLREEFGIKPQTVATRVARPTSSPPNQPPENLPSRREQLVVEGAGSALPSTTTGLPWTNWPIDLVCASRTGRPRAAVFGSLLMTPTDRSPKFCPPGASNTRLARAGGDKKTHVPVIQEERSASVRMGASLVA